MEEIKGYQTNNRMKIMGILKDNRNRTLTVEEIGKCMTAQGCSVNRTTIYRYLEKLEQDGTLMKYVAEKGKKTSYQLMEPGGNCEGHLHLQCSECGKVLHMDCEFMKELQEHIVGIHHFEIEYRNSILYGICEQCRKKLP